MRIAELEDFIGLIGVVIGFALGAGYQEYRERERRKRLRDQLLHLLLVQQLLSSLGLHKFVQRFQQLVLQPMVFFFGHL